MVKNTLEMKCPAQVYTASPRPCNGIPEPHYPFHDRTINITGCGRVCLHRKKISLSKSLAGQAVGVNEVEDGIWLGQLYELRSWLYRSGRKNFAAPRKSLRAESVTCVLRTNCVSGAIP
jgi:hypothetical protein